MTQKSSETAETGKIKTLLESVPGWRRYLTQEDYPRLAAGIALRETDLDKRSVAAEAAKAKESERLPACVMTRCEALLEEAKAALAEGHANLGWELLRLALLGPFSAGSSAWRTRDYQIRGASPEWMTYELPEAYRSKKTGRGQAHKWYLCRLTADESKIRPDGVEFDAWRWVQPSDLLSYTVEFRLRVYKRLLEIFASHL